MGAQVEQVLKPAVVLLSGGLDSATTLAIANTQGFACHALSFSYGQRQAVELEAAGAVAQHLGVADHKFLTIDLRAFGGSALTTDEPVPKGGPAASADGSFNGDIPMTYVPARNTIFLAFALAYAEVLGSFDIFIGVNAVDYSGYPDCRPEFIHSFQAMANLATKAAVQSAQRMKIHTPLIDMRKANIISTGVKLGVNYSFTHSCYDPISGLACGGCDACVLRRQGFLDAGVEDPTRYADSNLC